MFYVAVLHQFGLHFELKRSRAFLVLVTSLRRARAAATANVRPPAAAAAAAAGTMAAGRVNWSCRC